MVAASALAGMCGPIIVSLLAPVGASVERGAAGPVNGCANNSNGEAASSSPGIFRPFRKKVAAVTKIRGAFSGKKTSEV